MDVYINGQKIRLHPSQSMGQGGEADVYDIGRGKVLKLFKQPNHADYQDSPLAQQAARDRIAEHQHKLRWFPNNLLVRVIQPQDLVSDKNGQCILGYTMQRLAGAETLMKYSDRTFRQSGISHQTGVEMFRDLHTTVADIHPIGVVIGDFNDLHVLVCHTEAYIIEADSFTLPKFPCRLFTVRFVDPLLCGDRASTPILRDSYALESDWYAFAVMLMQCLLFVHPYGGVYRPKDPAKRIPHDARSLHRNYHFSSGSEVSQTRYSLSSVTRRTATIFLSGI